MKEIRLRIQGYFMSYDADDDMELITEGKMYQRGDAIYLTYDEGQLSGLEGCKARLKLIGDTVKLTRKGSSVGIDTEIEFEKGKKFNGYYDTPFGPIEMEVLTNDLKNSITYNGDGSLNIDYDISLKGLLESRSKLNIEILQ